jgi:hypothetical protein
MLTDERVKMIQQLRGTTHFSIEFIKDFDRKWTETAAELKKTGIDFSGIKLVPVHTEYKKVRT